MKSWQLKAPKTLEHTTIPDIALSVGQAKAKILKTVLTESDVAVYTGETRVKYPLVLGRSSIGQIVEVSENSYMKKGDRVYLPVISEDENSPDGIKIAGETTNGHFIDFAIADETNSYVLPASISDEAAFLIDAVALAEHIIDENDIGIGQHVLVMGGGVYGNIFCQILIYHRAVPILADNNEERLDRAKKCGIYYTFHNDDTLKNNVLNVTGGKLADAAVYFAFANKSEPSALFSMLARNSTVSFATDTPRPLAVNLENAIKNNISIKCFSESREFISTAINILANKAVNYNEFIFETSPEETLPGTIENYAKNREVLSEMFRIYKFIF